ncbi:TlpA disulfide reductase family protein [Psychroflexus planctonicus]|uniref:Thioredoxin domain-containing protein n=1 Tax=Psychroflexus planctonicus TaxID=1526575 RepID=A0ABQ1SPA7_9FLAO|nr:TlpA disulfide reductase family protein [Psychroflexus planctonicus]GGE45229.1 hypothetical protein GCM10010832_26420 [Psychroflexus planctonicus]
MNIIGLLNLKPLFTLTLLLVFSKSFAQEISGQLSALPNQSILLKGFNGLDTHVIDSTQTDEEGHFVLEFAPKDYGMALLVPENNKSFLAVLEKETVKLNGENTSLPESIQISKGAQNKAFMQYARQQPKREQALSAWEYLQKFYADEAIFNKETAALSAIEKEIQRIYTSEQEFLDKLPSDSYLSWYIPVRKLLSSVSLVAQYKPEEIPATRQALRKLDYAGERLYTSGLLKDALENHVWFIENSSGALDQVFADLNESIDLMLEQLIIDEAKYNTLTEYLFNLLEKRSLFTSAEYLALKVLNEQSCSLNDDVAKQLESYRQMKKGNTAPDIRFGEYTYFPEGMKAASLKEINATYKVVVFAAGWCGHCREQIPELAEYYPAWKDKTIEVVLVSLDENTADFANFTGALPFLSTTTLKKWDTKAAQDYHIYATPTYFLLNEDLKIILKPKNLAHLNAYIQQLKN